VPEDWESVAEAINARLRALGMTQRELVEASKVSVAVVRELQRNTVQRRRSSRTLEALSLALGWHPRHLEAVARGRRPPEVGDPVHYEEGEGTANRISAVEARLEQLAGQISEMNANLEALIDHVRANSCR
jgi:transcriptional regulator with XRE-family HTH domain